MSNKQFACIESMTKRRVHCVSNEFFIRVWRQENSIEKPWHYDREDIDKIIQKHTDWVRHGICSINIQELIEELGRLPRVNAVELLDEDGDGIVVYLEWP